MFRKMLLLTILAIFMVGTVLLVPGGTSLALAQDETVPEDTACKTCHEDQYYLYDSGKWYCLNETKVGCTECHGGNPGSATKECAHQGLIASPLANDAAVCQDCHPDDYLSKVQTFASVAGIRPTPRPYSTYTPQQLFQPRLKARADRSYCVVYFQGPGRRWGYCFLAPFSWLCSSFRETGRKSIMDNPGCPRLYRILAVCLGEAEVCGGSIDLLPPD